MKTFRNIFIFIFFLTFCLQAVPALAAETPVYVFGRANCEFCAAERTYLDNAGIPYTYYDVVPHSEASTTFDALQQQHGFKNVTPVTVIGAEVFQGFDGASSTGAQLLSAIQSQAGSPYDTLQKHLASAPHTAVIVAGSGCDANGVTCSIQNINAHILDLPFYGLVDASFFSPFALAPILGLLGGVSMSLLWLGLLLLATLFLASERRTFERRTALMLLIEVLTMGYLLTVPDGSLPVAALHTRLTLALVAVTGVLGLVAAVRQRRLIVGESIALVIAVLSWTLIALAAAALPLTAYLAPNALVHTFVFVLHGASLGLVAKILLGTLFNLCFLVPQLALLAITVMLWHRYILRRTERERYFAIALLGLLLVLFAILGSSLIG